MIQSGHGRSWDKPFALWFAVPLVDLEPDELMDYLKAVRTHRSKGQGSEKAFPKLATDCCLCVQQCRLRSLMQSCGAHCTAGCAGSRPWAKR